MKGFFAGMNNFFVGLISGLLIPVIIIVGLLYLTVDKLTSFTGNVALAPLYERSEQTLDKVDSLLITLDDKVDQADLKNIKLLAPLKDANLFPEFKQLATSISELKEQKEEVNKEEVISNLKIKLTDTLGDKFSQEQAEKLADSFANIADVIANKKEKVEEISEKAVEKLDAVNE